MEEYRCCLDYMKRDYSFACRFPKDDDTIIDIGCDAGLYLNEIKNHMHIHGCNIRAVGLDEMTVKAFYGDSMMPGIYENAVKIEPHLDGKKLIDTINVIHLLSGMSPRGKGNDDVIKLVLNKNIEKALNSYWNVVRHPTDYMND